MHLSARCLAGRRGKCVAARIPGRPDLDRVARSSRKCPILFHVHQVDESESAAVAGLCHADDQIRTWLSTLPLEVHYAPLSAGKVIELLRAGGGDSPHSLSWGAARCLGGQAQREMLIRWDWARRESVARGSVGADDEVVRAGFRELDSTKVVAADLSIYSAVVGCDHVERQSGTLAGTDLEIHRLTGSRLERVRLLLPRLSDDAGTAPWMIRGDRIADADRIGVHRRRTKPEAVLARCPIGFHDETVNSRSAECDGAKIRASDLSAQNTLRGIANLEAKGRCSTGRDLDVDDLTAARRERIGLPVMAW